jgi:hypothetical protein
MTFGRDQDAAAAEDYFGERVAARYDELHADMVDSSVVEPAVDFLTRLANHGAALESSSSTRSTT